MVACIFVSYTAACQAMCAWRMATWFSRTGWVVSAAAAGMGAAIHGASAPAAEGSALGKPAVLGGEKTRKQPFPSWPFPQDSNEQSILAVLRSGKWFRGDSAAKAVGKFEEDYARLTGAKYCIGTNGGTSALMASLAALEVGPGDEVIVTPYTFIATINSILMSLALPVLVDVDAETFQIHPGKIEAAITERTAAIMPVHIGGSCADMDAALAVGKKHNIPVIEDACQAHLAEWRKSKAGTLGTTGCFSFQVTKNLPSGEGGAILTNDADLAQRMYAVHNNCRPRSIGGYTFDYMSTRAGNFRMTEFQGAVLTAQMIGLEERARTREENAKYLTGLLQQIPGILPAKTYEGCTRNAYHLYMMRYQPEEFAGLSRDKFLTGLQAEGVPCFGGYSPIDWPPFVRKALTLRGRLRVYSEETLADWAKRCQVPQNDKLCKQSVWLTQNLLLGPRSDMDQIAEAVRKIRAHAGEIAKAS
jgi:dTDP-4-amino-4,6-dideoxygalactose transaminase